MNKTIVALYGRAGEGKTSTIKNVISIFEKLYRFAEIEKFIDDADILAMITLNGIKIGFESQGDPNSRMLNAKTIEILVERGCEIIICATRTEGKTVAEVDRVGSANKFNIIWKSSYYVDGAHTVVANQIAAEEIVNLIQAIIVGRI